MDSFAFIIHPIHPKQDVSRKYPLLGRMLSEKQINFLSTYFPPVFISEIEGITSQATAKQIRGWFIACPLTPARMLELPEEVVYRKIIQTGRLAEKLGAKILGLGAFTSVIGDAGVTIARNLDIPVTTGDSYTVAIAVQAVQSAAREVGLDLKNSTAAVVGANGSIGQVCSRLLLPQVRQLLLVGRRRDALQQFKMRLLEEMPTAQIRTSTDMHNLKQAAAIISVTSATSAIIQPEHLRPRSVICDVSRPRDVSRRVAAERPDVLVIDGGMVSIPGPVDFNFDFGFPARKAYACMAETMALTLEGRFENFTLGKNIQDTQVEEINQIADKHGFRLGGFRRLEKPVEKQAISRIQDQPEA